MSPEKAKPMGTFKVMGKVRVYGSIDLRRFETKLNSG
jgi:hypothetical protein